MSDVCFFFFFFQAEDGIRDVAVTGVQTCALPIFSFGACCGGFSFSANCTAAVLPRSEEHTSELQSRLHLVCRLLLEKKNKADRGRVPPACHDRLHTPLQLAPVAPRHCPVERRRAA